MTSQAEISKTRKRKMDEYGQYSPDTRAIMARYCIENGPSKAASYFSSKLGRKVNESMIRSMQDN